MCSYLGVCTVYYLRFLTALLRRVGVHTRCSYFALRSARPRPNSSWAAASLSVASGSFFLKRFHLISVTLISWNGETSSGSSFWKTWTAVWLRNTRRASLKKLKARYKISLPFLVWDPCPTHIGSKLIFKLYLLFRQSLLSPYDCITAWWQTGTKVRWWPLGFFRAAARPCIKWRRGEQGCNLINALKTVKMDNERAKSQMAWRVCACEALWQPIDQPKRVVGRVRGVGMHGSDTVSRDRCSTAVTRIY